MERITSTPGGRAGSNIWARFLAFHDQVRSKSQTTRRREWRAVMETGPGEICQVTGSSWRRTSITGCIFIPQHDGRGGGKWCIVPQNNSQAVSRARQCFCLLRLTTFHFSFESSHSKTGDKVIEEGSERERVFMKRKQIRADLLRNLVFFKASKCCDFFLFCTYLCCCLWLQMLYVGE